jgi:phosphate:Na+ symporter
LAQLAQWISPSAEGLAGTALLAAETPRQIANVHTFFNIANAVLFVGFTTQIARLVEWLIPDRPLKPRKAMLPKYLDDDMLDNPSIALEAVRSELKRMGKRVRKMVMDIMPIAISGTREDLDRIAEMDKVVDALHHAIIEYLGQISLANLSKRQSRELLQLVEIANALEQIGDRIATGMVTSANKRIDENVIVSEETAQVLNDYHAMVVTALKDALKAVSTQNSALARQVRQSKKEFTSRSRGLIKHGLGRLTADEPNRLNTYTREMEVMELLDIVYSIARRIARTAG